MSLSKTWVQGDTLFPTTSNFTNTLNRYLEDLPCSEILFNM